MVRGGRKVKVTPFKFDVPSDALSHLAPDFDGHYRPACLDPVWLDVADRNLGDLG
jgi:hypothetical protein